MPNDELTIEDVKEMSPKQVNDSWVRVQDALTADRHRAPVDADEDETEPTEVTESQPQRQTWVMNAPLSMDYIKSMSVEEHVARMREVDAFLSGGRG